MLASLVVGLGGTGSWVVAHLKERLVDDARWRLLDGDLAKFGTDEYMSPPSPVLLRAVDVDQQKRPNVRGLVLDRTLEDVSISGPVGETLEAIQRSTDDRNPPHPTIQAWLPQDLAKEIAIGDALKFQTTGAGQVRQFGRVAFFLELMNGAPGLSALNRAISTLSQGARSIEVFVVGSVAGGTGAGVLLDTLLYLRSVKDQTAGQVNLRSIGFLVLPGAYKNTVSDEEFPNTQANGFATLRELDRLVNAHETVSVSWPNGQTAQLASAALDTCYLVDGSRDIAEGTQLEGAKPAEHVIPAGIADAIYAHVFPSSGAELARDYPQLDGVFTDRSVKNRYSSFGSYSVTYAWEPMTESFTLRGALQLIDRLLDDASDAGRAQALPFLSSGATGALASGGQQQELPAIATEALANPVNAMDLVIPGSAWLEPRGDDLAPMPSVPNLSDAFPGLGRVRTEYENEDVKSETERVVAEFWGPRAGVWEREKGLLNPQYHPAANHNLAACQRQWDRALRIAVITLMNRNLVGSTSAALGFVNALDARVKNFGEDLAKSPSVDLTPYKQAVMDAENEMNDQRKFDDMIEQRAYLRARQDLLEQEFADENRRRVSGLVALLSDVLATIRTEIEGWRSTLKQLHELAQERRVAVDDGRQKANEESPLRRYLPLPGDAVEEEIFKETFGASSDPVPTGLQPALAAMSWSMEADAAEIEMLLLNGACHYGNRKAPIKLGDLQALVLPTFSDLRKRSVFEMLERTGTSAEALVSELTQGGARLASWDATGQFQLQQADTSGVRDWDYVFTTWIADQTERGASLSAALKDRLDQLNFRTPTLDAVNDPTGDRQVSGLPTKDKIEVFTARHLIALQAFRGVSILKGAYDARRGKTPGPHLFPEERGAARLEAASEELKRDGKVDRAIERVPAELVAVCGDEILLRAVVICAGNGLLTRVTTSAVTGTKQWQLVEATGADPVVIGDEAELVALVVRLAASADADAVGSRQALIRAADTVFAAGGREGVEKLVREGVSDETPVPIDFEDILKVIGAQVLAVG